MERSLPSSGDGLTVPANSVPPTSCASQPDASPGGLHTHPTAAPRGNCRMEGSGLAPKISLGAGVLTRGNVSVGPASSRHIIDLTAFSQTPPRGNVSVSAIVISSGSGGGTQGNRQIRGPDGKSNKLKHRHRRLFLTGSVKSVKAPQRLTTIASTQSLPKKQRRDKSVMRFFDLEARAQKGEGDDDEDEDEYETEDDELDEEDEGEEEEEEEKGEGEGEDIEGDQDDGEQEDGGGASGQLDSSGEEEKGRGKIGGFATQSKVLVDCTGQEDGSPLNSLDDF